MAKIDVQQFISDLKEMSVLELNELVKAIEEEFGVTAAAMAVAAPAAVVSALQCSVPSAQASYQKKSDYLLFLHHLPEKHKSDQ